MARVDEIGEADDWRCWLCGSEVSPDDRSGGPWSPTVDHVIPRVRGGATSSSNLRLAHARCNRRRSSGDPVIDWPDELAISQPAPLFGAACRVARSGAPEIVGLCDPVTAERASAWIVDRLGHMFRGSWRVELVDMGTLQALRLVCTEAPEVVPVTRRRRR